MCEQYKLSAFKLANKWDAFRYTQPELAKEINMKAMELIEADIKAQVAQDNKRKAKAQKRKLERKKGMTVKSESSAGYPYTPLMDRGRQTTKDNIDFIVSPGKRYKGPDGSPSSIDFVSPTPSSRFRSATSDDSFLSPSIRSSPPTGRYGSRTNATQVVASFNAAALNEQAVDSVFGASLAAVADAIEAKALEEKNGGDGDAGKKAEGDKDKQTGTDVASMDTTDGDPASVSANRVDYELLSNTEQVNIMGEVVPFRYMHEDGDEKRDTINERCQRLLAYMTESSSFQDFAKAGSTSKGDDDNEATVGDVALAPLAVPSQTSVYFGGRVLSDDEGRLKLGNLEIEGDRNISMGRRAKLRLGLLKQYALFPGQVVVGRGVNTNGTAFVVEEMVPMPVLPHLSHPVSKVKQYNAALSVRTEQGKDSPLKMMMAAGPFTSSDNMNYSPLFDLLKKANEDKPDVLLLMGPFLSATHRSVSKPNELKDQQGRLLSYHDKFVDLMCAISNQTKFLTHTKVLIVPSMQDVHHDNVFPQPAFRVDSRDLPEHDKDGGRLMFLPNPAVFRVNDVSVAVSNIDVLLHLSRSELFKQPARASPSTPGTPSASSSASPSSPVSVKLENIGGKAKVQPRVDRLACHLLKQHSLYPLLSPMNLDEHIDMTHHERLDLEHTPDVLVLPSQLKNFVSDLGCGTLCMNPQQLTKGEAGGYYGMLNIHARDLSQQSRDGDDAQSAGLVKGGDVISRCRAEIIRI